MKIEFARKALFGMLSCILVGCGDASVQQKDDYKVDMTDPKLVLTAVFDAANGASPSILGGLCDPQGGSDLDTKRICDLSGGFDPEGEFVQYFRNGSIKGEAEINGDTAWLPFEYGPAPARADRMQFIRRGENWYLYSF